MKRFHESKSDCRFYGLPALELTPLRFCQLLADAFDLVRGVQWCIKLVLVPWLLFVNLSHLFQFNRCLQSPFHTRFTNISAEAAKLRPIAIYCNCLIKHYRLATTSRYELDINIHIIIYIIVHNS